MTCYASGPWLPQLLCLLRRTASKSQLSSLRPPKPPEPTPASSAGSQPPY